MAEIEAAMSRERARESEGSLFNTLAFVTVQMRRIVQVAAYAAGALVVAMTLFMTFDVLMRYGLGRATAVADEMTAYMLVGITFLGAGSTELRGKHISVETFVGLLGPRPRVIVRLATLIVTLGYVVFLATQVVPYVATSHRLLYLSSGLIRVPLWIPQMFIPVGVIVLLLALLVNITETAVELAGRRLPAL